MHVHKQVGFLVLLCVSAFSLSSHIEIIMMLQVFCKSHHFDMLK